MKKMKRNRKGQAIVEYIIIVVVVAVGALGVMGLFSDTIKSKMAGVINVFDGVDGTKAGAVSAGDSLADLKGLQSDGTGGDDGL